MAAEQEQPAPRIVRTREDAFRAGWEDAAGDRPLSRAEIDQIAALWRPYFRRHQPAA